MEEMGSLIKHREIRFCRLHPDPHQAHSASLLLADVEGVHHAKPASSHLLQVSYDVRHITLHVIEDVLVELGHHLDNTLLTKLKRSLYHYTEETQRANLGLHDCCSHGVQVFINRYQRLRHGCRDRRPDYWRSYL